MLHIKYSFVVVVVTFVVYYVVYDLFLNKTSNAFTMMCICDISLRIKKVTNKIYFCDSSTYTCIDELQQCDVT